MRYCVHVDCRPVGWCCGGGSTFGWELVRRVARRTSRTVSRCLCGIHQITATIFVFSLYFQHNWYDQILAPSISQDSRSKKLWNTHVFSSVDFFV